MKYITLYKTHLLILCFFLNTVVSKAQNQNLEWTAESSLATINGTDVAIRSNLSLEQSIFSWQQISNLSDSTTSFSIVDTTGSWNWQDHTGNLNYSLSSEYGTANLSITKVDDDIHMHLVLYDNNNNPYQEYVFAIDSLTNL